MGLVYLFKFRRLLQFCFFPFFCFEEMRMEDEKVFSFHFLVQGVQKPNGAFIWFST